MPGVQPGSPLEARPRGGRYRIEVSLGTVFYDLDEAAAVLAYMLPYGASRLGKKTLQREIRAAGRSGVSVPVARQYSTPAMRRYYRDALVTHGLFPESGRAGPAQP